MNYNLNNQRLIELVQSSANQYQADHFTGKQCRIKTHKHGSYCMCAYSTRVYMFGDYPMVVWEGPCGEFRLVARVFACEDRLWSDLSDAPPNICWVCAHHFKRLHKGWTRDLTREGVEPNPGPWFIEHFDDIQSLWELTWPDGVFYCPSCFYARVPGPQDEGILSRWFRDSDLEYPVHVCPCGEMLTAFHATLTFVPPHTAVLRFLWYLEEFPFRNYFQWLPQEVIPPVSEQRWFSGLDHLRTTQRAWFLTHRQNPSSWHEFYEWWAAAIDPPAPSLMLDGDIESNPGPVYIPKADDRIIKYFKERYGKKSCAEQAIVEHCKVFTCPSCNAPYVRGENVEVCACFPKCAGAEEMRTLKIILFRLQEEEQVRKGIRTKAPEPFKEQQPTPKKRSPKEAQKTNAKADVPLKLPKASSAPTSPVLRPSVPSSSSPPSSLASSQDSDPLMDRLAAFLGPEGGVPSPFVPKKEYKPTSRKCVTPDCFDAIYIREYEKFANSQWRNSDLINLSDKTRFYLDQLKALQSSPMPVGRYEPDVSSLEGPERLREEIRAINFINPSTTLRDRTARGAMMEMVRKLSKHMVVEKAKAIACGGNADYIMKCIDEINDQGKLTLLVTLRNSIPPKWRFLLDYVDRADVRQLPMSKVFGLGDSFSSLPAWLPYKKGIMAFGWREFSYHVNVPAVVHPRSQSPMNTPSGKVCNYLVGPLPYSNQLAFFFNECWSMSHFQYLEENGWRVDRIVDDVCVYKRYVNPTENWWTVPDRYEVQPVPKDVLRQYWWGKQDLAEVPVLVDTLAPNLFSCLTDIHDGSYVTACRVLLTKFSPNYGEYWSEVVVGTALAQGNSMVRRNATLESVKWTDTQFKSAFSGWLFNLRLINQLYLSSMKHTSMAPVDGSQLDPCYNHALNVPGLLNSKLPLAVENPGTNSQEYVKEEVLKEVHAVVDPLNDHLFDENHGELSSRQLDTRLADIPILQIYSVAHNTRISKQKEYLYNQRRELINLNEIDKEWEMSFASMLTPDQFDEFMLHNEHIGANCGITEMSVPIFKQQDVYAVCKDLEGNSVTMSIYEMPPYDTTRIKIETLDEMTEDDYSGARPELAYWIHAKDLYVPSPHSGLWTVAMRCGKSLPDYGGELDNQFSKFCDYVLDKWNLQYDPTYWNISDLSLEEFQKTIENMPGPQARKRLEAFLRYQAGGAKDNASTMTFFPKTDESLFANLAGHDDTIEPLDPSALLNDAGKPRSIFNASDWTFASTQPSLMAAKKEVKKVDDVGVQMGDYVVEMPQELVFHHEGMTYYLRYMADTTDVQDAAFMTRAWNGQKNEVFIAVGGDDNTTVLYWGGHRYELEGDLSMCDQSMRGLFRDIFGVALRRMGMPEEILTAILRTYDEPACYYVRQPGGRLLKTTIQFLEPQLKTGVAHTSFSNTFIVGLLILFGLQRWFSTTLTDPDHVCRFLVNTWATLGITMKLKVYVDSTFPRATYHKRYFVLNPNLGQNVFSAVPLPSAIVKMCAVRMPQKLNLKKFFARVKESARSRAGMSLNPAMRNLLDCLGIERPAPKTIRSTFSGRFQSMLGWGNEDPTNYSNHVSHDSWAAYAGDGEEKYHIEFMMDRYKFSAGECIEFIEQCKHFEPDKCYIVDNTPFGRVLNAMFLCDNG